MPQPSVPFHERTDFTLRISELPSMGRCPGFLLSQIFREGSTKAADTGTLAGRLVQLFHELGEDPIALDAATRTAVVESGSSAPRADIDEAIRVASMYALDQRNWGVVVPGSCELEVRLTLNPAPEDPTQRKIVLVGHLDQIRTDKAGRFRLWDTKNGKLTGLDLLYGYAWQLAAYALAATEHYGRAVLPGGIIRLQGYSSKLSSLARSKDPEDAALLREKLAESDVFFAAPWTLEACQNMMLDVVQHVAWLRSGIIHHHPGAHCVWCPAGGPHLCGNYIADAYPTGVPI